MLRHPGAEPTEHAVNPTRRLASSPFEIDELFDLVDDAQPVVRSDQDVRGILDPALRSGEQAQLVDDEGGEVEGSAVSEDLPSDSTHPAPGADSFHAQDLGQGQ